VEQEVPEIKIAMRRIEMSTLRSYLDSRKLTVVHEEYEKPWGGEEFQFRVPKSE